MIVSNTKFAEIAGYSPRQVAKWLADGMPAQGTGKRGSPLKIDTGEAIRWLLARAGQKAEAQTTITEERRRLVAARAERAEIETAQLRDELVPRDDVVLIYSQALALIVQTLSALPAAAPSRLRS